MTNRDAIQSARKRQVAMMPMNASTVYPDLVWYDLGESWVLNRVLPAIGKYSTGYFHISHNSITFLEHNDVSQFDLMYKLTK